MVLNRKASKSEQTMTLFSCCFDYSCCFKGLVWVVSDAVSFTLKCQIYQIITVSFKFYRRFLGRVESGQPYLIGLVNLTYKYLALERAAAAS